MEPEVITRKGLGMRLCVPKDYTKKQIIAFAEAENPCGTTYGWHLQKDGDGPLMGDPARVPCGIRKNCVHVVVSA